jgi:hypothetical protein
LHPSFGQHRSVSGRRLMLSRCLPLCPLLPPCLAGWPSGLARALQMAVLFGMAAEVVWDSAF